MATPLYHQKKEELLNLLSTHRFVGNRLPPEAELTQMLSCSRSMLREILAELEQKGFVTKRHSVGNFVHPRAFSATMRPDIYPRFVDLIARAGYKPSIVVVEHSDDTSFLTDDVRKQLELDKTEGVNYTERLYYADSVPAILCRCYIPSRLILRSDAPVSRGDRLLGNYFRTYCDQEIAQLQKQYLIEQADERMARLMDVPVGKPLQVWWESYYNCHDEMICLCVVYHNLDVMKLVTFNRYQQFEDAGFFLDFGLEA